MWEFERLLVERDRYNHLMLEVMSWRLHLKKADEKVKFPLSDIQKQKNIFLYKYYEFHYNRLDTLIHNSIYDIHEGAIV